MNDARGTGRGTCVRSAELDVADLRDKGDDIEFF